MRNLVFRDGVQTRGRDDSGHFVSVVNLPFSVYQE